MVEYEAMFSRPSNLAQVRAVRRAIEAVGGQMIVSPPTKTGLVRVLLRLPMGYTPAQFLPGMPFYPA
jgi:hypothetical protein